MDNRASWRAAERPGVAQRTCICYMTGGWAEAAFCMWLYGGRSVSCTRFIALVDGRGRQVEEKWSGAGILSLNRKSRMPTGGYATRLLKPLNGNKCKKCQKCKKNAINANCLKIILELPAGPPPGFFLWGIFFPTLKHHLLFNTVNYLRFSFTRHKKAYTKHCLAFFKWRKFPIKN